MAILPLKVIQGHRCWYQSTYATFRQRIWEVTYGFLCWYRNNLYQLTCTSYFAPFPSYREILIK